MKIFLDGREDEELTSSFTWGGLKEDLSPVPDGVYSIKLKAEGQSWENTPVMIAQVTVTSRAPGAPAIVYPTAETGLVVNENLVALKIKGTPGSKARIYLDDEPIDSVFLDARERGVTHFSCLWAQLKSHSGLQPLSWIWQATKVPKAKRWLSPTIRVLL